MKQNTPHSQPPRRCKSPIAEDGQCHEVESDAYCRVSFASTVRMIEPKKHTCFDPTKTWYTRQEASVFQRDWKLFTKHYIALSQRRGFDKLNLAGLEDINTVKARSSKRKFHIQSVLLQQDIHHALQIEDAEAIASVSKSYSKATFDEALQRAGSNQMEHDADCDSCDRNHESQPVTSSLSDIPKVVSCVQPSLKEEEEGYEEEDDCHHATQFTKNEVPQPDHRSFEKRMHRQWIPNTDLPLRAMLH